MQLQAQPVKNMLDQLEVLLDDPDLPEAMSLDEIQGFLCAARAGPLPMAEEDWLIYALGSEEAQASNAGREAAVLLRVFADALEKELALGEPPVLLLYAKDDEAFSPGDYLPWCNAYLRGVDSSGEDWFEFLGEGKNEKGDQKDESPEEIAYIDERLFPFMLLTGEAEAAARESGEQWPESDGQLERECEEDLPQAVADLYRFWLAKRGIKPMRRATAKVGRNDPCPCGSQKKFKQCCGAS